MAEPDGQPELGTLNPRPQRPAGRISSRLVLLGLLNFAGFTVVIAILIHTFQSVEEMTSAAADGQMARAAVNAAAVRQVAGLYPLTRALTAVLSEADGRLSAAVAELRRTLEGIAAGGLSPADRATFDELSTHLTSFVSHGERVASLRAEVAAREDQALGAIARLEQALFQVRLDGARAGTGDDSPLAQRQALLAAGREALLAAGRKRTDRPTGADTPDTGETPRRTTWRRTRRGPGDDGASACRPGRHARPWGTHRRRPGRPGRLPD